MTPTTTDFTPAQTALYQALTTHDKTKLQTIHNQLQASSNDPEAEELADYAAPEWDAIYDLITTFERDHATELGLALNDLEATQLFPGLLAVTTAILTQT